VTANGSRRRADAFAVTANGSWRRADAFAVTANGPGYLWGTTSSGTSVAKKTLCVVVPR
jgi:hypothetical protein